MSECSEYGSDRDEAPARGGTSQLMVWDITLSRHLDHTKDSMASDIRSVLKRIAKKWAFQGELSEPTDAHPEGYKHWQIRLSLIKKKKFGPLKTLLDKTLFKGANIKPTCATVAAEMKKDADAFYVMKLDTRIEGEGPYTDKDPAEPVATEVIRFMQEQGLRPWQRHILESGKNNTQRERFRIINIILDKRGDIGKSMITEYLEFKKVAEAVPSMFTEAQDYMQWVMGRPKLGMYIFDMPRSLPKKNLNQLYAAIECIKDGVAFDKRYRPQKERLERPIIWVFTNEPPNTNMLSRDRWRFWAVTPEHTLVRQDAPAETPQASGGGGAAAALGANLRELLGL